MTVNSKDQSEKSARLRKFPKREKIILPSDFERVLKTAKKYQTPSFTIFILKSNLVYARLGISISKRVVSRAHERNRIRRIIREVYRTFLRQLDPYDWVFIIKKGSDKIKNRELFHEIMEFSHRFSNKEKALY